MRRWGNSSPEWTVFWVTSETIELPCDMTRGETARGRPPRRSDSASSRFAGRSERRVPW